MPKQEPKNITIEGPKDWNSLEIIDFLSESNKIEDVDSIETLEDAIEAWNYAYLNREKIDHAYLLEVHKLLCQRIHPDIAGKWRDCDVWIGGERKPFISEDSIRAQVGAWLKKSKVTRTKKTYTEQKKDALAREWHIAIEHVHPHADGNGRTYRIIMNVQRYLLGLPILVIDARTRYEEYYTWFRDN